MLAEQPTSTSRSELIVAEPIEPSAWLQDEARARDDVTLWRRLLESPYDDVRLWLVADLENRVARR